MTHIDAAAHTRGESQYVDDMVSPANMLYAAVFSSPVAHGDILKLYTDEAFQIKDVVAVLTAKDIPGSNQIGPIIQDQPLFARDRVHYVGEPIAVVIARSLRSAQKGVRQIKVDISERIAVTDPREAFENGDIIGTPRTIILGNVDAVWKQCDFVIKDLCDIGGQEHVYLETQRARAVPLEGNGMKVYSSTQSPYAVQRTIASVLGVANHCIEVDVKRLGGGFGGKEDQAHALGLYGCFGSLAHKAFCRNCFISC